MESELKKDMALFAKYIRRLGLKYPKVYMVGSRQSDSTTGLVTYRDYDAKKDKETRYFRCKIDDAGKLKFY